MNALNVMNSGLKLGTWFGIPVTLNWSLLPIAILLLIQFSLSLGVLVGILAVVGLYFSIVAHEYGHALTARFYGIRTQAITLHIFDGVAKIMSEPRRPAHELLIALAGPAVSLVLAGIFFGLSIAAGLGLMVLPNPALASLANALAILSVINLFLGVFNLLPGYPMDGGRVLRAWLWHRSGSRRLASWKAARVGEFVAYGLMGCGVLGALGILPMFGFMTILVGWFLLALARSEKLRAAMDPGSFPGSPGSSGPGFSGSEGVRFPTGPRAAPLAQGDVEYIVRYPDGREVTYRARR